MKIREAIIPLNENELIYIGSKSGWFWIGTKKELVSHFYGIDGYLRYILIVNQNEKRFKIENILSRIQKSVDTGNDIFSKYKAWANDLEDMYYDYLLIGKSKNDYVSLVDRDVIECYKGIYGKDIRIKVEGDEPGKFWTKEEFDKNDTLFKIEAFM